MMITFGGGGDDEESAYKSEKEEAERYQENQVCGILKAERRAPVRVIHCVTHCL